MSDDKTEEPTQKKLNDARKKGQVAQSKDVSSTVMLAVVLAFLFIGGNWIFSELSQLVAFAGDCAAMPFDEALPRMRVATTTTLLKILIPLAGIVALFAIAGGFSQVGPLLAFEPLKPELKKLNPKQTQPTQGIGNLSGNGLLSAVVLGRAAGRFCLVPSGDAPFGRRGCE